ncbi:apolipoprotein N-acyltransferase [Candidatus Sororendozoicomonas aggregata]|uniref:apolipoprotein N-acyltransferase n=1 Tax=Candidatus Sororendozoicomonas aggregata TaxID=3073239 RepID=UPI002ED5C26E
MMKKQHLAKAGVSLIAGSAITLGLSPFELWPIVPLALAAAFLVIRELTPKQALYHGLIFGTGLFGAGASWIYVSIHQFGAASLPLATALTALFVISMACLFVVPYFWLYGQIRQKATLTKPWQQALLFSALWLLSEWTRSWLLTGFPWLLTGYALMDTPFDSWAPITGVYGLSFLLVCTSSFIASMFVSTGRSLKLSCGLSVLAALCWLAAWPLGTIQWTKPVSTLSFSAIQGNIPQNLKWDPSFIRNTLSTYTKLSDTQWQQDLIIWPENAIPLYYNHAKGFIDQLDREAKVNGATLITGLPIDDNSSGETRFYNGVISLGQGSGRYYKQKLVPFGEYVPLEGMLRGVIAFFDLPMSSFSRGPANQPPLMAGDTVITPYICYEVVYPDFVARMARNSGLLITISNDTWFGTSIGPEQHFQMARMRALETGRYLIRATNDGITALVDNHGDVVKTIPRFQQGVLRGKAEVMTGNTPFMVLGSWPVLIFSLLFIGFFSAPRRRQSPAHLPGCTHDD